MTGLAQRLGCTEGQVYTSGLGLLLAVLLMAIGLPPVLEGHPATAPAAATEELAATEPPPVASSPPATPSPVLITPPTGGAPSPVAQVPVAAAGSPPGARPPAATPTAEPAPPPVASRGRARLSVISSGYTSATGGTPLSGPEVPEDGLPVGARLGQVDKMSFLRLAGTGTSLRFGLVEDPGANQLEQVAAVEACPITEEDWSIDEPGAPPSQAPAYDSTRCVAGERESDGSWMFDLAVLAPLEGGSGVALVPVVDGASTFQVTFSAVASPVVSSRRVR